MHIPASAKGMVLCEASWAPGGAVPATENSVHSARCSGGTPRISRRSVLRARMGGMWLRADASTSSPLLILATITCVVVMGSPGARGEVWSLQRPVCLEERVLRDAVLSLLSLKDACPTMFSF